jgi:hypothetical protein
MALLTLFDVARRFAAILAFVALLVLALTLLWRVHLHHLQADPYEREDGVRVLLDVPGPTVVNIAVHLR